MLRTLLLALLVLAAPAAAKSPKAALNELLAADRAFSAASAKAEPVAGITAMLDDQVAMPLPGKGVLVGKAAVTDAFKASPAFKEGHVTWTPVRGGISADGTQGFTYGFLNVGSGDEAKRNRKYLAYWIKRPTGWRVVAYRQIPREAGTVSTLLPFANDRLFAAGSAESQISLYRLTGPKVDSWKTSSLSEVCSPTATL